MGYVSFRKDSLWSSCHISCQGKRGKESSACTFTTGARVPGVASNARSWRKLLYQQQIPIIVSVLRVR